MNWARSLSSRDMRFSAVLLVTPCESGEGRATRACEVDVTVEGVDDADVPDDTEGDRPCRRLPVAVEDDELEPVRWCGERDGCGWGDGVLFGDILRPPGPTGDGTFCPL